MLKHGLNQYLPFQLGNYGLMLCGVLGKVEKGYKVGQLATELSHKIHDEPCERVSYAEWINKWIPSCRLVDLFIGSRLV